MRQPTHAHPQCADRQVPLQCVVLPVGEVAEGQVEARHPQHIQSHELVFAQFVARRLSYILECVETRLAQPVEYAYLHILVEVEEAGCRHRERPSVFQLLDELQTKRGKHGRSTP